MAINLTEVYLMSTPLTNDYKHTLYFSSKQKQVEYFLPKAEFTSNLVYLRKDTTIKFPRDYEELLDKNINYVMYRQPGKRWFYAFVTDMKFISEGVTELTIETDVMQTWLVGEDFNVLPSFIEREHTDDDTAGNNLVPENLDTGEFIVNSVTTPDMFKNLCIVVSTTLNPEMEQVGGQLVNGIYGATTYYCAGLSAEGVAEVNNYIKSYDEGKADAITSVFIAPNELITGKGTAYSGGIGWIENIGGNDYKTKPYSKSFTVPKADTVGGHTPRNNKLLCYPYNYFMVTNNQGGSAIFHQEYFTEAPSFKVVGALTPGCSIRIIPEDYKGVDENYSESLTLGKFPICSWSSDVYTNWLTQNGTNIALNVVGAVGTTIGGIATGNATAVGMGALQIANTLADVHQHSLIPPQASGNTNSGDVLCSAGQNIFQVYNLSVTEEFANILDTYFDMFGYKTNIVKEPNINHRAQYWFTKTIDVNLENFNVPIKDLKKIKDCYNNGITFWRNAGWIGNYSIDNGII